MNDIWVVELSFKKDDGSIFWNSLETFYTKEDAESYAGDCGYEKNRIRIRHFVEVIR